jgi:hypothetical protein
MPDLLLALAIDYWASPSYAGFPCANSLYRFPVRHNQCYVISFLQIPPRDGHPCLDSRFRPIRPAADLHRLEKRHAWRHVDGLLEEAISYVEKTKALLQAYKEEAKGIDCY